MRVSRFQEHVFAVEKKDMALPRLSRAPRIAEVGICAMVLRAVDAVAVSFVDVTGQERTAIEMVASMRAWGERGRLDHWERVVRERLDYEDDRSVVMALLNDIFDFGAFNLYAAMDEMGTLRELSKLQASLASHGIRLDTEKFVADW